MLEQQLFPPHAPERHAPRGRERAACAPHAPRQNRVLAALPGADLLRLLPDLESVPLPPGWTVHRAGDREKHIHFLTAGIVARFHATASGASAAFAVTGSEGVIGVAAFLGGDSTPGQAVVLSAGHAYRLKADRLKREFEHGGALAHLLLRYTQALIAHTGQLAVCNRHHALDRRLCHWILSCLDRTPSNELAMTHEALAGMLGVRRVGVTEVAGNLQQAGLVRCHRGHIAVLDRAGLEARACECYAIVRREYDRLLPSMRTGGDADALSTRRH